MNFNCKRYIIVSLLIASVFAANAQDQSDALTRELTLEKDYVPSLKETEKINHLPEVKEPTAPQSQVKYSNFTLPFSIAPYLSPMSPDAYFTELAASQKRGYLDLSISSLLDINGDAGYQILNSQENRLNLYLSHRSSNCDVDYLEKGLSDDEMKLNDTWGGLDYTRDLGNAMLKANAQYTFSSFNYYGSNNAVSNDKTQNNNLFEVNLGALSKEINEWDYKLNVGYTYFNQKYGMLLSNPKEEGRKESRLLVDADVHKKMEALGGMGIRGEYTFFVDDEYSTLLLNPYYKNEWDFINFEAGIKVGFDLGSKDELYLFPNIRMDWHPNSELSLYVTLDGGINDNSSYNTFYENRYVNPGTRIEDSSFWGGEIGLHITPTPNASVDIYTGWKEFNDEHFYTSKNVNLNVNSSYLLGLTPEYSDGDVFKLGLKAAYQLPDIFYINADICYNKWSVNDIENAYNKPDFFADLGVGYQVQEIPLKFDINYHLEIGRETYTSEKKSMKDIHDLRAKATYTFNDTWSFFAQANNLLLQKYDFWEGYPAQNFNIMGGLSVRF